MRSTARRPSAGTPPVAQGGGRTSEIVVVVLAVLTALMIIAQPANEGSTPVGVASFLPRTLTAVQGSAVEPAPTSTVRPRRSRAARATTVGLRDVRMERVQSP